MALTFFVKWRLWGGVSKARYFSTVWRCIPSVPGYPGVLHALLRKGVDGAEELAHLLSRAFFGGLAVQTEVRQPLKMHGRSRDEIQNLCVLLEHPQNHISQVLQEVETVRNLHELEELLFCAASAYSPPRSLLTTSTPGCSPSHRAKVSALLSGKTSTSV